MGSDIQRGLAAVPRLVLRPKCMVLTGADPRRLQEMDAYVSHRSTSITFFRMSSDSPFSTPISMGATLTSASRERCSCGARFDVDKAANRYKSARSTPANEEDIYRSPFTEVGSEARVGEYVLAINGENVTADRDIYSYLRGKPTRL